MTRQSTSHVSIELTAPRPTAETQQHSPQHSAALCTRRRRRAQDDEPYSILTLRPRRLRTLRVRVLAASQGVRGVSSRAYAGRLARAQGARSASLPRMNEQLTRLMSLVWRARSCAAAAAAGIILSLPRFRAAQARTGVSLPPHQWRTDVTSVQEPAHTQTQADVPRRLSATCLPFDDDNHYMLTSDKRMRN